MDNKSASFNRDFIYTIPSTVLFDKKITDLDRKIYMVIRSFMDTTGSCYPSNSWFSEKFNVDKRSIPRSIARLINCGYIKIIHENDRRNLVVNYTPCPEDSIISEPPPMTLESPPHDPRVTPPMTLGSSNTSSKISNSKVIKKLIATSCEVSTNPGSSKKPIKPKPDKDLVDKETKQTKKSIDVTPYIEAWNEIAVSAGSPKMGSNKRQIQSVKRNLKIIKQDWEMKLTPDNFRTWLLVAIDSKFYMLTDERYQKTMDVVLRWPHFYEAYHKGRKLIGGDENANT